MAIQPPPPHSKSKLLEYVCQHFHHWIFSIHMLLLRMLPKITIFDKKLFLLRSCIEPLISYSLLPPRKKPSPKLSYKLTVSLLVRLYIFLSLCSFTVSSGVKHCQFCCPFSSSCPFILKITFCRIKYTQALSLKLCALLISQPTW